MARGLTAPPALAALTEGAEWRRNVAEGLVDTDGQGTGCIDAGRAGVCIDAGRAGVADAYQDIAILWQNLSAFGPAWPAMLLREPGIATPDQRRMDFHRCLDELS